MIFCILFFAAMYAIKGGWHRPFRMWYANILGIRFIDGDPKPEGWFQYLAYQITDGKILSSIGVMLFGIIAIDPFHSLLGLAWMIGVASSMGEEAGAIGRFGRHWGPYIEQFGQDKGIRYGWTKGIQRGVFLAAPFTVLTGSTLFLIMGTLFPAIHFAGQQLYFMIHKTDSWKYAEPLIGGIIIGVCVALYMN